MTTQQNAKQYSVNFVSLGCPKNLVDSEVMMGLMEANDFAVNPPDTNSDVTVVNSCSFVEDSKNESIDAILEMAERKKNGQCQVLVVAGCLSQRYAEQLPELIPEVDLFIGTGEYHKIPGLVRHKLAGDPNKTYVENPLYIPTHQTPRHQSTPFYTRYVKIAEGCSHRCSFCIIPHLRGDLHSREPQDIFHEIEDGVNRGVKEFNLVSQDLNEYGRDLKERSSLYKLLDSLQNLEGEFWIRLMYMYPLQFPDKLVRLIAEHPHIAKYVDIPLQHISDHMLKIMNRGSSRKYIDRLLEQLRKHIPDITLRTTFIVGHPGETEQDFKELKTFIEDTEFDRVGVFAFSQEEGTPSFRMADQVDEDTKLERRNELMAIQKEISHKKNASLTDKTLKVLFEGVSEESELLFQGRTEGQAPEIDGTVLIRSGSAPLGSFCNVKIVEAHDYDLVGEIV